jgi:hypothetical protein
MKHAQSDMQDVIRSVQATAAAALLGPAVYSLHHAVRTAGAVTHLHILTKCRR